ncbi:hypothetical protein V2G26_013819 [Clonostachys chloroleuca]
MSTASPIYGSTTRAYHLAYHSLCVLELWPVSSKSTLPYPYRTCDLSPYCPTNGSTGLRPSSDNAREGRKAKNRKPSNPWCHAMCCIRQLALWLPPSTGRSGMQGAVPSPDLNRNAIDLLTRLGTSPTH